MCESPTSAVEESVGKKLAGKYLTFRLDKEEYGIEILKVQEIILMQQITRIPKLPGFIRGVINLRGNVVPVIALRDKFAMKSLEDTEKTCIIVVRIGLNGQATTMGIIIDEVREVLDIKEDQIQQTPSFGTAGKNDFIMGISNVGQEVKMLLDIRMVLTDGKMVDSAQLNRQ